ncbi:MAG TPA: hypothetical protein VG496_09050, partial [Myxococcales bacterium]|nr:hypothetical protein [Myxococcales bacterium]
SRLARDSQIDRRSAHLEKVLGRLRKVTDKTGIVTVAVEPGALRFEGERVYADELGAEGFCARLYRDGIRSVTFRRGLILPELEALARAALSEGAESGHDAVSELWKADLGSIQFTAARDDALAGHPAAAAFATDVRELASKARDAVEYVDADASLLDRTQPPPLWSEEQRKKQDPQSWSDLARRAALTIERIVEQDLAGWDLEALQGAFASVLDEMAARAEVQPLVSVLEGAVRMGGAHAPAFRSFLGERLAQPDRLARVCVLATAPVKAATQLLEVWTSLLPDGAGPLLLDATREARADLVPVLAAAAARRCASCRAGISELLWEGAAEAVLAALAALPLEMRAEVAAEALSHPDAQVREQALALVAADPAVTIERVPPLLEDPEVRVRAAEALSSCAARADDAATAIMTQLTSASAAKFSDEDLAALYAALGKLATSSARAFLAERAARPAKGLFRRRRSEQEQLHAIEALVLDGSVSALRLLAEIADPKHGHGDAVCAAATAAVERLRARRQVREGRSR